MNLLKKLGIIGSVMLIINHLLSGISPLFPDSLYNIYFDTLLGTIVFRLGLILFYYALSKYFSELKIESNILKAFLLLIISLFIIDIIEIYYILPIAISSFIILIEIILLVVFCVRVLRNKQASLKISKLKRFTKVFLITLIVMFFIQFVITFSEANQLESVPQLLLSVPYFYGITIFVRNLNNSELYQTKNIELPIETSTVLDQYKMKKGFKSLKLGIRRIIIVGMIPIAILIGAILEATTDAGFNGDGIYVFTVLVGIPAYWVCVFIGIWIYNGFKEEEK